MTKTRKSAEETKQLIMETARDLFARQGLNGISIRKIAEVAKINHTLIGMIAYFTGLQLDQIRLIPTE